MFEPEVFRKLMYCFEKKVFMTFWTPAVIPRPGNYAPSCPPRYVTGVMQ